MKPFIDEDFLLCNDTARLLYHNHAEQMPIIDYHCHINPKEIADNKKYTTITEVWLGGDHYKWRAMRNNGVPEQLITGDADDFDKFYAWAKTIPNAIANPLYHWTHLELKRFFGIDEPLTEKNALDVYKACNEILTHTDMSVRGIIKKSNVQIICTTDDPCDDLQSHRIIATDPDCNFQVLPAFRPDKLMNIHKPQFASYINLLANICSSPINNFSDLRRAISIRIEYFADNGCVLSDQALDPCVYEEATDVELNSILHKGIQAEPLTHHEIRAFQTAILLILAGEYYSRGWVMQIHFGSIRNINSKMFRQMGPDTGYDAIDDSPNARNLAHLLDGFDSQGILPKMIIYPMNPNENEVIAAITGCFQTNGTFPARIQMGSAWWFNDHKLGIEKQLSDLSNIGLLGSFIGMLTDSRSFLSYTRHEYFRRILSNFIGSLVENGEYPFDVDALGRIVENICYYNASNFFNFTSTKP
jgi:glucuronate isomerase